MSKPLRNLMKKDTKFVWGKLENDAFQAITKAISEETVLSYYDTNRLTALFTDASPVGVNATFAQPDDRGLYRPVNITSRALTMTEQNYDQLEREAVSMHCGCFQFKIFLQGISQAHDGGTKGGSSTHREHPPKTKVFHPR